MEALNNLKLFLNQPLDLVSRMRERGGVVRTFVGPQPFVFVFDADVIQEILVTRASTYAQSRMVFDPIQPVTGRRGLVQLEGDESREMRAKLRPLFQRKSLAEIENIVEQNTISAIESLRGRSECDVAHEMHRLILRSALKIFLDVDSEEAVEEFGSLFHQLNQSCGRRMRSVLPAPLWIPTAENRQIKITHLNIRRRLAAHIRARSHSNFDQLIDVLADDPNLIDHCMTFIFAGHETTASSLAFTILLLAQHPEYQEGVGKDSSTALLAYKESLRLYPPAYMLARQAAAQDMLAGVRVQKGDQVIIGIAELHRDSRLFDQPDQFRPERFRGKLNHPFAFLPFGAGGKSCVGERLAYLEAQIVLRRFCEHFHVRGPIGPIATDPLITLNASRGQMVQLRPRRATEARDVASR